MNGIAGKALFEFFENETKNAEKSIELQQIEMV